MLLPLAVMTLLQAPTVLPLWPNGAPGSEARRNEPETKPHPWSIAHIYNPSLTVYLPESPNGTAVVIAPGGGHSELVVGEEGEKPAKFFNKLGVTAFVLRYRLFREKDSGLTFETAAVADTNRAMRYVRTHADDWRLDPKRIGMIGFSAGGENLSAVALGQGIADPAAAEPIDLADARPNFAIWIYPGPLGLPEELPDSAPPAFMLVASDDDHVAAILSLIAKYRKAKRPYEAHILGGGGHGFNMGDRSKLTSVNTWPDRLAGWLGDMGYLKR
ncbi:MAG TPA: alpha/beta hydrolase [Fimbriimonadaceae bacterium]|nr:alpha/beta hydrolase [Fimbriimonadaceae bacterium]